MTLVNNTEMAQVGDFTYDRYDCGLVGPHVGDFTGKRYDCGLVRPQVGDFTGGLEEP